MNAGLFVLVTEIRSTTLSSESVVKLNAHYVFLVEGA